MLQKVFAIDSNDVYDESQKWPERDFYLEKRFQDQDSHQNSMFYPMSHAVGIATMLTVEHCAQIGHQMSHQTLAKILMCRT